MAHTQYVVLFLALLGYGALAVDIDCQSMDPSGSKASTEESPFKITVSPTTFSPGAKLTVTLTGKVDFHNFLLQARVPGDITPTGSFLAPPAAALLKKCRATDDAITHKDDTPKRTLTFQWQAPNVEKVKFVATVLINGATTHHKVESDDISKAQDTADGEGEGQAPDSDEEEEGDADKTAQMEEEKRRTEQAKRDEERRQEADSRQPKGSPDDPTDPPAKPTAKPYVDTEENNAGTEKNDDDEEESVDPDETADAVARYHMEEERRKTIAKERHDKAIMDEREDYLRRMEEDTEEEEEEEEEKKPEVVIDKNKDRVEEKNNEKNKVTDGNGSACVSVSTALVLITAALSLF